VNGRRTEKWLDELHEVRTERHMPIAQRRSGAWPTVAGQPGYDDDDMQETTRP